ncbi:MAG: right-handed parallel beta-helix repeat-containing protein [Nanoarchaeota archaeon]|nr:right-handed parallel beta-helix repeat-containing protein [Nanoarchaeota archaeon]
MTLEEEFLGPLDKAAKKRDKARKKTEKQREKRRLIREEKEREAERERERKREEEKRQAEEKRRQEYEEKRKEEPPETPLDTEPFRGVSMKEIPILTQDELNELSRTYREDESTSFNFDSLPQIYTEPEAPAQELSEEVLTPFSYTELDDLIVEPRIMQVGPEHLTMDRLRELLSADKHIRLGPGEYEIDFTFKILKGTTLELEANTTIYFGETASLTIEGTLRAISHSDKTPIQLRPKNQRWGNLSIIGYGASESILKNVFIHGGSGRKVSMTLGGGLYIKNSDPTIESCIIAENHADHGGGIYIDSADPKIIDTYISNNRAEKDGGGMHCSYCDSRLYKVLFEGNRAGGLGGGICLQSASLTLDDCGIQENQAQKGGGIAVLMCSPKIIGTVVSENTAHETGGGIYVTRSSSPEIQEEYVTDNYPNNID